MSERLLEDAERIFRAIRTIPLDLAAKLMEEGYIVEELERRWARRADHVVCIGWTEEAEDKYADK